MRDPYLVLGVPLDADKDEIKRAFWRLAKANHPDQNREDFGAQERFAEINAAYQIVGDSRKRQLFDHGYIDARGKRTTTGFSGFAVKNPFAAFTVNNAKPQPANANGETPEDVIERIFGEAYQREAKPEPKPEPAPTAARSDRRETVGNAPGIDDVPLGDIERGIERGVGRKPKSWSIFDLSNWSLFNIGTGKATEREPGRDYEVTLFVSIEDIHAGGRHAVELPDGRNLSVTVAKGMENGHVIHLPGAGETVADGMPGDVVVTLRHRRHERFRLDGSDIHVEVPVTLEEAVFGKRATIPTLDGDAAIEIPEWSGSDRIITLPGKGLAKADGTRGDLVAEVRILLSAVPDEKLIDMLRLRKGEWYV